MNEITLQKKNEKEIILKFEQTNKMKHVSCPWCVV